MTPAFAALGVLLVIIAIPFGLMLAPLAIGALLVGSACVASAACSSRRRPGAS